MSEAPFETDKLIKVTVEEWFSITRYEYLQEHGLLDDYKEWVSINQYECLKEHGLLDDYKEWVSITQFQYLQEHGLLDDYKEWVTWKYVNVGKHTLPREALK